MILFSCFFTQVLPLFLSETMGKLDPFLETTATTVVELQQSGVVENGVNRNEIAFV